MNKNNKNGMFEGQRPSILNFDITGDITGDIADMEVAGVHTAE